MQKVDDPKKPVGVGVGPEVGGAGEISEGGEGGWAGLSRKLGQAQPVLRGRGRKAQGCLSLPPEAMDPLPASSRLTGGRPGAGLVLLLV